MTHYFRDILASFDVFGDPGHVLRERCQLLASTDLAGEFVELFSCEGVSSSHAASGFADFRRDASLGKFRVHWKVRPPVLTNCSHVFILDALPIRGSDQLEFCVDHDSVVVPLGEQCMDGMKIFEMFSGGYGGWHVASTYLDHLTPFRPRVVAIDHCIDAVAQYAVSHSATIVPGDVALPIGVFDSGSSYVIHGSIEGCAWLPELGRWRPNCICMSAPCPPWSSAGRGLGLESPEGRLFLGHHSWA